MKVSVCIPVYGVERHIERCARSLFGQTMKEEIEFIFVNDATPDRSEEVLRAVLEEYPERKAQTVILRHAENRGLTGARNTALKAASGAYIIHCDSDDTVDPALYETMYRAAVGHGADAVCCDMVQEVSGRSPRRLHLTGDTVDDLFFRHFNTVAFNSLCNKMFARGIAQDPTILAPDRITMAEDLLRTTQMLLKCRRITVCGEVAYHYFRDNAGASTRHFSAEAFRSQREVIGILLDRLPEKYGKIADACRGQLLFSALRIPEIGGEEFRRLYPAAVRRRVIFNRHLAFAKRAVLALSLISVPLGRAGCAALISLAQRMQMG